MSQCQTKDLLQVCKQFNYIPFNIHTYIETACMFGDPHIITLDGFQYTFNGKGEFILIEAIEQQFVLQGRMTEPLHLPNSSSLGTAFTALAVKLGRNPTIQLEVENNTLLVFGDGERIDFAGLPEQQTENVTILNKGNQTIVVRIVPGVSLEASNRNGILTNILITVPEDFSTKGLLGQFNGDASDDLLPRNSTLPLHTNATAQDIYHQFGLTCKDFFIIIPTKFVHITRIYDVILLLNLFVKQC